ncbi:hypothetical protein GALL_452180 [mine drainage metagenome]|uniref:Uncharacterized protein n=1 Tax=mine drainage metagenome TaxID=410659 RepID=A0A1J5Q6R8_9ZZZZ
MAQQTLKPETLIDRKTAVRLCNLIGYHQTYGALAVADHRGDGPIRERFNRETWYKAGNVLDWIEQRLGCTIKTAVERGRLRLPVDADLVLWHDDLPVLTADIE